MRLPLVTDISSRDGSSTKNGRMYNVLAEKRTNGDRFAAVRPGLTQAMATSGPGKGIVCWNGTLISMYGTSAYKLEETTDLIFTPVNVSQSPRLITFGNGYFVGIDNTYSFLSQDGISWDIYQSIPVIPAGMSFSDIAASDALFCAVDYYSDSAITSSDGISWVVRALPTSTYSNWNAITWNGSIFCAVGSGTVAATSTDGISWTARTMPSSRNWTSIAWNGTVFCAISGNTTNVAATSTDGISWTARTLPITAAWEDITSKGSLFCAIGGFTSGATSTDGISWTARTLPSSIWNSIFSNGTVFCAIGLGANKAATSPDGSTWTVRSLSSGPTWFDVSSNGNLFVVTALSNGGIEVTGAVSLAQISGTVSGTFFDFAQSPT